MDRGLVRFQRLSWPPQADKPVTFAATLAVSEVALALIIALARAPFWLWMTGHIAILSAAITWAWVGRRQMADASLYVLAMLTTLEGGLAGACGALVALIALSRNGTPLPLLEAWYDRIALAGDIDPVTRLYNEVAMGRSLDTNLEAPPAFEAVMTTGSLADRQAALGLIARKFAPGYAPALRLALVSPEPVIRVQAAAVAVKVRADVKTTLAQLLALDRSESQTDADKAVQLRDLIASGLLDDDDAVRAQTAYKHLMDALIQSLPQDPVQRPTRPPAIQSMIEAELLSRRDYAGFRRERQRGQASPHETNSNGR